MAVPPSGEEGCELFSGRGRTSAPTRRLGSWPCRRWCVAGCWVGGRLRSHVRRHHTPKAGVRQTRVGAGLHAGAGPIAAAIALMAEVRAAAMDALGHRRFMGVVAAVGALRVDGDRLAR